MFGLQYCYAFYGNCYIVQFTVLLFTYKYRHLEEINPGEKEVKNLILKMIIQEELKFFSFFLSYYHDESKKKGVISFIRLSWQIELWIIEQMFCMRETETEWISSLMRLQPLLELLIIFRIQHLTFKIQQLSSSFQQFSSD